MTATEIIRYVDTCFRDYPIRFLEVEHDRDAECVRIPIIAPDPEASTSKRFWGILARNTETFVKWWIEIGHVRDMQLHMSERMPTLTEIELGSAAIVTPHKVVISGQYVLSIEVDVDDLNLSLYKEKTVLFTKTKVGLNMSWGACEYRGHRAEYRPSIGAIHFSAVVREE